MSRDSEAAKITAQLDGLLVRLQASVDALSAILSRPVPPDADERLV